MGSLFAAIQQFGQIPRGNAHPGGDGGQIHAGIQKPLRNGFHLLADFDDVAVGVVKPHDALAPAVLHHIAQALHVVFLQLFKKRVKLDFLKGQFHVVRPFYNMGFRNADKPGEILLQRQAADERDVDAVIPIHFQTEQRFVEFSGTVDVCHR